MKPFTGDNHNDLFVKNTEGELVKIPISKITKISQFLDFEDDKVFTMTEIDVNKSNTPTGISVISTLTPAEDIRLLLVTWTSLELGNSIHD